MKTLISLSLVCFLSACASSNPDAIADHHGHIKAGDSSKIAIGMSKQEVMRALGKPENSSADAAGETLTYQLERPWWQDRPFRIEFQDDKVTTFSVIENPSKRSN